MTLVFSRAVRWFAAVALVVCSTAMVRAGTETDASESTMARVTAFDAYAQFVVADFTLDVNRLADRNANGRAFDRAMKQRVKLLDKEAKTARKELLRLIKDFRRDAHGSGRELQDLRQQRLADLELAHVQAEAALHLALANALGQSQAGG